MTDRDLWFGTKGPHDARIVVVGEAWGYEELQHSKPFMGSAGQELDRLFLECGIDPSTCLYTNVIAAQPHANNMWTFFHEHTRGSTIPEVRGLYPTEALKRELARMHEQLLAHPRDLVIGVGNYPLWGLSSVAGRRKGKDTNNVFVPTGIGTWRGSMIYADVVDPKIRFLPIYHPAAILRQWELRTPTKHDLSARVKMALRDDWERGVKPIYWAPPTFDQARLKLTSWLAQADGGRAVRLACDVETTLRSGGILGCIGFADSVNFAMSIPFMKRTPTGFDSWWTLEQEAVLLRLIAKVLTHPRILIEGQNFIYDAQYIYKWLGVLPRCDFDSMLAFHLLFPGVEKGLDYLSSLFCQYHRYWKDDGKEWDVAGTTIENLLSYNCEDLVRTFEICDALRVLIPQFKMEEQWLWVQRKRDLALRMMIRGVPIDRKRKEQLGFELLDARAEIDKRLEYIIPQGVVPTKAPTPWYRSAQQTKWVLGEFLGMDLPKDRKTKSVTTGKEALNDLPKKYPEWSTLFDLLATTRSVGVFISTFILATIDADGRMRSSFNPAGTETFRWSSSKNAFGGGGNMQNLPRGTED